MANAGARKYTQIAAHMPDGKAEARVRAGFMLIPESGDSMLIKVATRKPATQGVNRVSLRELETFKTMAISRKEIVNSAAKAIHGPPGPGTVATYRTRINRGPGIHAETRTPAQTPANCPEA